MCIRDSNSSSSMDTQTQIYRKHIQTNKQTYMYTPHALKAEVQSVGYRSTYINSHTNEITVCTTETLANFWEFLATINFKHTCSKHFLGIVTYTYTCICCPVITRKQHVVKGYTLDDTQKHFFCNRHRVFPIIVSPPIISKITMFSMRRKKWIAWALTNLLQVLQRRGK